MSRPVVTPSQLQNAIRHKIADARAEGFLVGLALGLVAMGLPLFL